MAREGIQIDERSISFEDGSSISVIAESRLIYINCEITNAVACFFIKQLLVLEALSDSKPINIYINSPGGSVIDGLAMIDMMQTVKCDIITTCVGCAASMGSLILMHGTKGKRRIFPRSEVMIHQVLGSTPYGQATDLKIRVEHTLSLKDMLNHMIADATGQDYDKVVEDCERDHYLNAQQALEYGIVDEIVKSRK